MKDTKNPSIPPRQGRSCRQLARRIFGVCCVIAGAVLLIHTAGGQQQSPISPATHPAAQDIKHGQIAGIVSTIQGRHRDLLNARAQAVNASLAIPLDDLKLQAAVKSVANAELSLAEAQADATAQQHRDDAVAANVNRGQRIPNIPDLTDTQVRSLTTMTGALHPAIVALNRARDAVTGIACAEPRDDAALTAAVQSVSDAELRLARERAVEFEKLQVGPDKLSDSQFAAFASMGGVLKLGGFSEPKAIDFDDHDGYISLFDGKTLKGWDGNPKIWRVVDGAIVGESTIQNPSGNTYLVCRDHPCKDFTLKFEIKIDGQGGSGMQYRSKTGVPWLAPVAPNLEPVNLDWMMTGPQADFWPAEIYSGQFYSENTPLRIIAWRGQVVESSGLGHKRLMANISTRKALGDLEKKTDWNQYTVIARGGTFLHIMNGQLMSALIDDNPDSSNNQSGLIGIEIEAITKLYVRNIWLKNLDK